MQNNLSFFQLSTPDAAIAGDEEKISDLAQRTVEICDRLGSEVDRIRANYWQYRINQINALAAQANTSC